MYFKVKTFFFKNDKPKNHVFITVFLNPGWVFGASFFVSPPWLWRLEIEEKLVKIRKKGILDHFFLKFPLKILLKSENPLKFQESTIHGLIRLFKRIFVRIRMRLQNSTDCHPYYVV